MQQAQRIRRNSWSNYLLHQFLFSLSEIANPHWNASVSVGIHHLQLFHQKVKKKMEGNWLVLAPKSDPCENEDVSEHWKHQARHLQWPYNEERKVKFKILAMLLSQMRESDTIHLQCRHPKGSSGECVHSPRHNLLLP